MDINLSTLTFGRAAAVRGKVHYCFAQFGCGGVGAILVLKFRVRKKVTAEPGQVLNLKGVP